ncbi:hypothetical protein [Dactylosporangium darangshiense]
MPLLAALAALAVAMGMAAALAPAIVAGRSDVLAALTGRRLAPRAGRRLASAALAALLAGAAVAAWGVASYASRTVLAGLLVAEAGLVLSTPALLAAVAGLGGALPPALRIALRDAARNRTAAAPAVSAVMAAVIGSITVGVYAASLNARTERMAVPTLPPGYATAYQPPTLRTEPAPARVPTAQLRAAMSPLPVRETVEVRAVICADPASQCGLEPIRPPENRCPYRAGSLTGAEQRAAAADLRCDDLYHVLSGDATVLHIVDDGRLPGPVSSAPGGVSSSPGPGSSAPGPGSSAPGPGSSAPGPGSSAPGPGSSAPGLGSSAGPGSSAPGGVSPGAGGVSPGVPGVSSGLGDALSTIGGLTGDDLEQARATLRAGGAVVTDPLLIRDGRVLLRRTGTGTQDEPLSVPGHYATTARSSEFYALSPDAVRRAGYDSAVIGLVAATTRAPTVAERDAYFESLARFGHGYGGEVVEPQRRTAGLLELMLAFAAAAVALGAAGIATALSAVDGRPDHATLGAVGASPCSASPVGAEPGRPDRRPGFGAGRGGRRVRGRGAAGRNEPPQRHDVAVGAAGPDHAALDEHRDRPAGGPVDRHGGRRPVHPRPPTDRAPPLTHHTGRALRRRSRRRCACGVARGGDALAASLAEAMRVRRRSRRRRTEHVRDEHDRTAPAAVAFPRPPGWPLRRLGLRSNVFVTNMAAPRPLPLALARRPGRRAGSECGRTCS